MTDLATLVGWFFYGFIRYVIFWIPLLTPPAVNRSAPWQWFRYNDWDDWLHYNDNNGGPDEVWLQAWFRMVWGESLRLAEETAKPYVRLVRDALQAMIGAVKVGYASLSAWIDWLERLFGWPLPWWSSTVRRGLVWLRGKLPAGIREAWQTWEQIWNGIKADVKAWVRLVYDSFRDLAQTSWNWISGVGEAIRVWFRLVGSWVNNFRANPYGTITGWLGSAWQWLLGFRADARNRVLEWLGPDIHKILLFGKWCCTFYFNLWSRSYRTLSEFVDDPRAWLYSKIEQVLVERW